MNTQSKQIDWVKVFAIVTAIVFAFLWLKGCTSSNPEPQIAKVEVTVPEVHGAFKPQKPINTPVLNKANPPQLKQISNLPKIGKSYFDKSKKAIVQNEPAIVNLTNQSDSIVKEPCEHQINNFSTKFEDDNIELNIEGVADGTVKEITPSYKWKERQLEVPVKQKETVLRVLVGAEVGVQTSLQMNKLPLKANLMLQNKKGNIWSASIDNNQTAWIGFNASIFNWKK